MLCGKDYQEKTIFELTKNAYLALRFFERMEQTETFKSRGLKVEFSSRICPGERETQR